jgi:hypothetical protein
LRRKVKVPDAAQAGSGRETPQGLSARDDVP